MKIDKGVPIPPRSKWAALFNQLEVGDSFRVPADQRTLVRPALQAYWIYHAKDKRFVTRTVQEDNQVWIRIWRTA